MRCSAHGVRSAPPCGSFPPHWRAWARIRASRPSAAAAAARTARCGKYADAFFADAALAQLENGTPLPDGWREAAARRHARRAGAGCAIRSYRRAQAEEDAVLRAPCAAAQALREARSWSGAAKRAGYSTARDDALLQPESPLSRYCLSEQEKHFTQEIAMDIDLVFKIAAIGIVVAVIAQSAARALGPARSGDAREPCGTGDDDDAARAGDQLAL